MKKLLTLTGLTVLAGLVLSVSTGRSGARTSPEARAESGGRIVFSSNRDGDYDIYAVNPDGTGLTQLTHNGFEDSSPYPSPDGRLIAFYSDAGFSVMNADGSGRRRFERCGGTTDHSWSPDSSKFVCDVETSEGRGLGVADVATGAVTTLVQSGGFPSWSPDGRTIAFVDGRLFVKPAEGGTRRRIGRHRYDGWHGASWSPDSQRLAYAGEVGSGAHRRADLFTVAADGSDERSIVRGITAIAPLEWSPEGSLIAFERDLPHYGVAVYTARPDGTGLQRVTANPGHEASTQPTWSTDGTELVYLRERYRDGEDDDIYVTTPGAGEGRAVTHPFPQGGTNIEQHWTTGEQLSGGEPIPPTIALPLTRNRVFAGPLGSLTTDGRRAIPGAGGETILVWDAITRRTTRVHSCGPDWVALAGRRLAWTCVEAGNTYTDITLKTSRLGARRPSFVVEAYSESDGSGMSIGDLVGHGNTIAFTAYWGKRKRPQAWVLLPRHGGKCPENSWLVDARPAAVCRRLTKAAHGVTASVDSGRVLTVARNGVVRLVSTHDRLLRTWRLGRNIVNARLRGHELAVQQGTSLDLYDTATGAKRQTLPLSAGEGLPPYLLDVQGDFVVYVTGGAIHLLRLSDGRDVALDIPGAAPPLDARLEPRGLFVTWNQMYKRRPGRLAFVPLEALR